jgi:hypothetical protein
MTINREVGMPSITEEIATALSSDTDIRREKVVAWISSAGTGICALSMLYRLTGEGYYRIKPELGGEVTCSLIQKYLLECVRQDVKDDDDILGRWEAADTLHFWLRQLLESGCSPSILLGIAKAITELFLVGGEDIRDAIEMGFLKHALETAALRPYFENWASNPQLHEAWERALAWGKAHPDQMWARLQEIRRLNQK